MKVIFRKERNEYGDTDIIALFPEQTEEGNIKGFKYGEFCDFEDKIVRKTKPAEKNEYQVLKVRKQLEKLGYNLEIVKKFNNKK